MSRRRTQSGGAARRSEPRAPSPKSLRRSLRKSGSDFPSVLPEICQKASPAAPVRKPIVLKKIVAQAVEVPAAHSPRRSPRIAFFLGKENNPVQEPKKVDLFKTCSVPATPATTPVLYPLNSQSCSREGELDARYVEMSKKVRRSYSRLDTLGCASTSTPGLRSCFGFEDPEDLSGVSPVLHSKLTEIPKVPAKLWSPDTNLPGISPQVMKEKRKKKKVPEILSSRGQEGAHSGWSLKPVVQPVEVQQPEEPRVSRKLNVEDATSLRNIQTCARTEEPGPLAGGGPALDTHQPGDLEIQESRFLSQQDWGPQRTSEEMKRLQNVCVRLRKALSNTQADNLALGEKLRNLPSYLYEKLKEEMQAGRRK